MKRNMMVIMCDQLRKDFLPIYGGKAIETPAIDGLATEGVVFNRCITASTVCAPARASMMTGRYVSDHGVWTNDVPFRDGLDYIGERMVAEGYRTGAFGKLHHTPGLDTKGFQHARLMEENRLKDKDHYYQWLKESHPEAETIFNVDGDKLQFAFEEEVYYEHYIAEEAIKYMTESSDQPFFTWVSFQGPHTPYDPPKKWRGQVKKEHLPKPIVRPDNDLSETAQYRGAVRNISGDLNEIMATREAYGEMIMEIDSQINRIITALKDQGLYETTTILFTADHGDLLGDMNLGEKGPFCYESQLGIPMIMANHKSLDKGTVSEALVGNIDVPGTVLHIAGGKTSIGSSISMLQQLEGSHHRRINYSEFCDSIRTIEDERYRYCYYPFEDYAELYDRKEDPMEVHNLVGKEGYDAVETRFLKAIIDYSIMAKGPHIEAQDLVPSKKKGIEALKPDFLEDFDIVFPLPNRDKYRRLKAAGLDPDYNEFCQGREIIASYGRYWEE